MTGAQSAQLVPSPALRDPGLVSRQRLKTKALGQVGSVRRDPRPWGMGTSQRQRFS